MRKIIIGVVCLLVISANSFALAEDVYITKNGSRYHKADCRFIKNRETEKISKEAAIEEGFKPCSRCYKEDAAVLEKKQTQALSKK